MKLLLTVLYGVFSIAVDANDMLETSKSIESLSFSEPMIAIILDDVGNQYLAGKRAAKLPGPVALAVLPHTPFGATLAELAHAQGKEILLHQPLQATRNNELLGSGAIELDDDAKSLAQKLTDNLATVPYVSGVNNHMGSLLTRHPGHMRWLMQELQSHGDLFFVDSFTTKQSVALGEAQMAGLPSIRRHVFLDNEATEVGVKHEFERLKRLAKKQGYAVAIGHPYPATLAVLEKELPELAEAGYRLIGVQRMIEHQSGQAPPARQTARELQPMQRPWIKEGENHAPQ